MNPLQNIEWEDSLLEPRKDSSLERESRRRLGFVPNSLHYYAHCPWVGRSAVNFWPGQLGLSYVDSHLADLVSLVVSRDNSCRYCYAASRALLRVFGFSEARIQKLEHDLLMAELREKDRLALEFARKVSRFNPVPGRDEKHRLLEVGHPPEAIKELAFLAVSNAYYNRLATITAMPPQAWEKLPDTWYVKLARPWIVRRMAKRWRRGEQASTAPDGNRPFARLVAALDGLHVGNVLRSVIDDAWSSNALPPRTRALVFAVVARGLGCQASEEEAIRLLGEEGLAREKVLEILSNLASPDLDEVESLFVPFARETIWYVPVQIQRRARALRARLTAEQFLDGVATASLANTMCRLSVALERCK